MKVALYCKSYHPNYLDALEYNQIYVVNIPWFLFSEKWLDNLLEGITDLIPGRHKMGWFKL